MKILVIRLSSIGDVVLTTPVLRCLKKMLPDCELHLITKRICSELIVGNPNLDRLIVYDGSEEQVAALKWEGYDCVVDLHNNHHSRRLRRAIGTRTFVYRKENLGKFMLVLFKWDIMSGRNVVDRYFDAVSPLGVSNDGKGLELPDFNQTIKHLGIQAFKQLPYVVIACGAQHETKRIPPEKIAMLANKSGVDVVLVGDDGDRKRMESVNLNANVRNLCGKTTLQQSAALIAGAMAVVTPDSAMMHVAAAYKKKVIAVWGCTSPRFGFWAYGTEHIDFTANGLRCWPCRRMGTERCPKGHFKCMMQHDYERMLECVNA